MDDHLVPAVLGLGWVYCVVTLSFAAALDRSLECLCAFLRFGIPVKGNSGHAFQRPKKLRISAEKTQKCGTQLLR